MNDLLRYLDIVTMNSAHDPAFRNVVFLVASIVLYAIFINLEEDRCVARMRRPLRSPDSILRG